MIPTIATLFSGGEGVGIGARAAGYRHLWGIEFKPEVVAVAEMNGFHSIVADVRDVDPRMLEHPDVLHASPPCLDASGANGSRVESQGGKALGRAIARYVRVLQPRVFTLENIWYYRTFESFQTIVDALFAEGYMVDWEHLNAADFGVPQTRQRLILRAVRGSLLPQLPQPEPWIGWYEAIEDLIPTLPESQFAPWQLERLPEHLSASALFSNQNSHDHDGHCYGTVYRESDEPAMTVRKALLGTRAFLVGSHYGQPSDVADRRVQTRNKGEPSFTITASDKGDKRAWLSRGRVMQMTPRALARFQSFPDSYLLPESRTLACYVIGNAVPPLMYEKIVAQFL